MARSPEIELPQRPEKVEYWRGKLATKPEADEFEVYRSEVEAWLKAKLGDVGWDEPGEVAEAVGRAMSQMPEDLLAILQRAVRIKNGEPEPDEKVNPFRG